MIFISSLKYKKHKIFYCATSPIYYDICEMLGPEIYTNVLQNIEE